MRYIEPKDSSELLESFTLSREGWTDGAVHVSGYISYGAVAVIEHLLSTMVPETDLDEFVVERLQELLHVWNKSLYHHIGVDT